MRLSRLFGAATVMCAVASFGVAASATVDADGRLDADLRDWCSENGRRFPGSGRLEWKPLPKPSAVVDAKGIGDVAFPGDAVIFGKWTTVDGARRIALVAIDVNSLRMLPFRALLPRKARQIIALTASSHAAYVAYSHDESPFAVADPHAEIVAFDRRTGRRVGGFRLSSYTGKGHIAALVYARGKIIVAGRRDGDARWSLIAYDAATGAPRWRSGLPWWVESMAPAGSRLFVSVPAAVRTHRVMAAVDLDSGRLIPGWGRSIATKRRRDVTYADGVVKGVDAGRVFATSGVIRAATGRIVGTTEVIAATRTTGRPVALPHLPRGAVLRSGTSRTILGGLPFGRGVRKGAISAMFDRSGRLIGTVCSRYDVLVQRDDRHLVVADIFREPGRTWILVLARPR